MTRDDILSLLTRVLGPLKTQPQDELAHFEKFQDVLKQMLTQPAVVNSKSGIHFPDFHSNELPEKIIGALEKMADEIIIAQAARTPNDPVFWMRERNIPGTTGLDESPEGYLEPSFSFGPFVNRQSKQSWFDFYRVGKQLRFEVFGGGIPDLLVITLNDGDQLPAPGTKTALSFEDCSIWISVKSVAPNGDKKYIGVRAKRCEITFSGFAALQPTGFITAPNFELSFEPFDALANSINNDASPKVAYPDKIALSFTGTKWSLLSFPQSAINLYGDTIPLGEGANVLPVFLEPEKLVQLALPAGKDSWEINGSDTDRFHLYGRALITDTGWYLPVVTADSVLGVGALGKLTFSGYLGFRTKEGLDLDWPGLENGKLALNKTMVVAKPGRMVLKYSYTSHPRRKQEFSTWKAISGGEARSLVNVKPLPEGDGIGITDNQGMEALLHPVSISARVDQPLNANRERFNISGLQGLVVFLQAEGTDSVHMLGGRLPPAPGAERKRRIPQSLCLRNALLTTDNPVSLFMEGNQVNDSVPEGFLHLVFPVYRLVNTLPDPYFSNQDDIFGQDFGPFNELWRLGKDTLPDQFLFSATSIVHWSEESTSLEFVMNQPSIATRINDEVLLDNFRNARHPCSFLDDGNGFPGEDINKMKSRDPGNVIGSFGFLQWLPGNRSLVDVSGRASLWGVSFSTNIAENRKLLSDSLGYPARFPFRIKNMELVSSGRMSRLFTLPHIQWEPVMKIDNPSVPEPEMPDIINFTTNGSATRISSASKNEVALVPRKLCDFIIEGFTNKEIPYGVAAHFNLPFGICAFAYFNPRVTDDLPSATTRLNEPEFTEKKTGPLTGGMQVQVESVIPPNFPESPAGNRLAYFIGSARQLPIHNSDKITILGDKVTPQFLEFTDGQNAKVPLQRIDFSGYGASIFSNWLNEKANFGRVNQVKFDVMIGRTAHEVIQIKSILFPWGVPVVRSIVIQRKNAGVVTRYDTGWVAQGPGTFDFLSHTADNTEVNPYKFHPNGVTGIYNVREIRDLPEKMDIFIKNDLNQQIRFSGVYFNGDIEIEDITRGALPKVPGVTRPRVHSAGQFGYVMLADPTKVNNATTLLTLFPANKFKLLLNHPNVGGTLGGPVNAEMNIAGTGQRMQATRVDISASNEANVTFVVTVRGTTTLPKEGSWTVVKCLPSKDIVPLNQAEAVPLIRNGLLTIERTGTVVTRKTQFNGSHHCLGDPAEIDKYAVGAAAPALQYGFLQTTDTQKLLFRRPSFFTGTPQKVFTDIPDLADSFRLIDCKTIFPNLSKTLSLPNTVKELIITGEGSGLKLDDALFDGPASLQDFVPQQLGLPENQVYKLIDTSNFKVLIRYGTVPGSPSAFSIDLNSEAKEEPAGVDRKKWELVNKDVSIEVHLGPLKPLLTLTGQFRSEAGKKPEFEKPKLEFGPKLEKVKDILQVLALLAGEGNVFADNLTVAMGNSPDSWSYKMSIEQRIPVIQFPDTAKITMSAPPPLIIEANLLLGAFFNLSLSPDPKNLIKPGAGAVFGFEGMIQILLISLEAIAAYGVGITKVKAFVDISEPEPHFEFTFGFGATVIVVLPVAGMVSVTRSVDITGSIDPKDLLVLAGQMLRGVLSLAGGLLMVAVQIEGRGGVERSANNNNDTVALFEVIFSLNVGLAFVVKYNFTKRWREEVNLSSKL